MSFLFANLSFKVVFPNELSAKFIWKPCRIFFLYAFPFSFRSYFESNALAGLMSVERGIMDGCAELLTVYETAHRPFATELSNRTER